jgi:hypothetical protein
MQTRKLSTPCWKVFCHLHMMELTIIFWFKVDNCLTIMSCDCVVYYLISRWWLRPFVLFNRTNIIHTFLINTITWFWNSFFDLTGSTRKRSANNILNTLFIFINDQLIDWSTTNSEKRVIYIITKQVWTQKCAVQKAIVDVNISYY